MRPATMRTPFDQFAKALVIVRELPRTRATLLLRLMGARLTLRRALDDLGALPADAPERILALPHLLKLRILAPAEKDLPMRSKQFLKHTEQLYQQFVHDTEQRGIARGMSAAWEAFADHGVIPAAWRDTDERWFTRAHDAHGENLRRWWSAQRFIVHAGQSQ